MTLDQYNTMVGAIPDVNAALAQDGEDVKTPDPKNEKKTKLAIDPLRDVEDDEEEEHPVKAEKQAVKSEDDGEETEDEDSDDWAS